MHKTTPNQEILVSKDKKEKKSICIDQDLAPLGLET